MSININDRNQKDEKFFSSVDEILKKQIGGLSVSQYWNVLQENLIVWSKTINNDYFWSKVQNSITFWEQEYQKEYGGLLFLKTGGFDVFQNKSIDSIKDKLVRKIKKNESILQEENTAFCIDELFCSDKFPIPNLSDLIRTRVTCAFLDGVSFLAQRLYDAAKDMGMNPELEVHNKSEGYYAQHITFTHNVNYQILAQSIPMQIKVEIQLATTLATRMWEASHSIYEDVRGSKMLDDWAWNVNDPRFLNNQLGHTLHLADGLLINLRNQKRGVGIK